MDKYDQNILAACVKEDASRVAFFLANKDLIYKNAQFDDKKYKERLTKLQTEIDEV